MWFKKWFRERFANHSKCDMATVATDVMYENSKTNIETIAIECDDSMICCHKQSIYKSTETNQINNTDTESISSHDKNKNENRNIDKFMETNQQFQVHVDKNNEQAIINDTKKHDIEISTVHLCGTNKYSKQENHNENNFSCITDVNKNGNGENDCDFLSKSKDPRLQTNLNTNNCNSNKNIAFDVYCADNNCSAIDLCTNEWPTQENQQCKFLHRQVKELEFIIADIGSQVNSKYDTNYNKSNCRVCDDQALADWVIISVELKPIPTSCENFVDENHISHIDEVSTTPQYYTTSEYSEIDNQTIVTLHRCPIIYTSNDEFEHIADQQDYGISYAHNRKTRRLLWFTQIFDCNIRTGTPAFDSCIGETTSYSSTSTNISANNNMRFTNISKSNRRDFLSSDSLFSNATIYSDYDYPLQEPCSSGKKTNLFSTPIIQNAFTSISTIDSLKSTSKCTSNESIPEYFGLNDYGDIIIHIDHICEEKGFGFATRRKKEIYRKVPYGEEVYEKHQFSFGVILKRAFKSITNKFCKCKQGHPRNKTTSGGPGDSIGAYALALAKDSTSTFSRNIENFITCTKDSRESSPQIVMRNMRQFMSGMKNYLVKHGEGDFQQEVLRARSMLKSDEFLNLDTILEGVMHQLVVLPLREHLYGLFVDYYTGTGDIQLLVENVKHAFGKVPTDFGIRPCIQTPSPSAMKKKYLLILRLQEAELPLAKLEILLSIVTSIIETTSNARGQALGADDFLPLLVYIVAKCGFIGAEIEAEFMWCLLQPSLLNGEAGYYLTALCSAVHVLKSFITSEQDGTGSLDFRSSSLPPCSSVLRVIIPDEYNGSLQTRTLPIRPHTTTREVCRTIAHKARVTNPQDYGLFKLVDGEETLLMDSDCPQEARLAARGKPCMLAYKRIDAKIAWPTTSQVFQ